MQQVSKQCWLGCTMLGSEAGCCCTLCCWHASRPRTGPGRPLTAFQAPMLSLGAADAEEQRNFDHFLKHGVEEQAGLSFRILVASGAGILVRFGCQHLLLSVLSWRPPRLEMDATAVGAVPSSRDVQAPSILQNLGHPPHPLRAAAARHATPATQCRIPGSAGLRRQRVGHAGGGAAAAGC